MKGGCFKIMAKVTKTIDKTKKTSREMPSKTLEGQENRMIAKAMKLIEQRIDDGTASAQETVLFAKMGTTPDRLEKELKEKNLQLMSAKTEALKNSKITADLMQQVMDAIRSYRGDPDDEYNG